MSKQSLRQRLLKQRQQLDHASCVSYSRVCQERVLASDSYAGAEVLALYASIHNEVHTDLLLAAALSASKRICYPRLEMDRIVFVEVSNSGELQIGRFGVPEPQGDRFVLPGELDLVVVPGVGFSRQGGRLGYGLGYYDRTLALCGHAVLFGLAYAFQLVEHLPEEKHDIRLDCLATECEMLEFKHKQKHLTSGGRT